MPHAETPDAAIFEAALRNQGLTLDEHRLAVVLKTHVAFRPALERMRQLELPYLDPIEPGHVLQWIENGGTLPHSG